MSFAEYIAHGWRLCAIEPPDGRFPPGHPQRGGKAPKAKGWNQPGPQAAIPPGYGAGLMHVESGTCAIDIDNLEVASAWLNARGVNVTLDALLQSPTAVRISSGRTGRAKLLYRLIGSPLQSIKTAPFKALSPKSGKEETYTALDFRCATKAGLSLQDVLPSTIHPDTGRPYVWEYGDSICGSWRNLPPLPDELRAVWESLITAQVVNDAPAAPLGASFDEMRSLLEQQDPNAAYNEWLRVGMALHHETGGSRDGLLLWNEWSAQADGAGKYKGIADLESHWRSFSATAAGAITLGSLRSEVVAEVSDFPVVPPSTTPPEESKPEFDELAKEFAFQSGRSIEDAPDLDWIVGTQREPLIPDAELGFVYGSPGAGKTTWLLDVALHVAAGRPWRDMPVQQRRVTYLAGEGMGGLRGREGRYKRARERLQLPEDIPFDFIARPPSFTQADKLQKLAQLLKLVGTKLVIVDTLARVSSGADENSAKDMNIVINNCKFLQTVTGAMVILIAHAGKDVERGIRGSSVLDGAADVEIAIQEAADSLRVAYVAKMRDGRDGAKYPFRLRDDGSLEHTDALPQTKTVKHRKGSVEDWARQIYPELSPIGSGQGVSVTAMVNALIERMPYADGTPMKEREKAAIRGINEFVKASPNLVSRNNVIYPKDMFELRPVDTQAPLSQDNSDLMR